MLEPEHLFTGEHIAYGNRHRGLTFLVAFFIDTRSGSEPATFFIPVVGLVFRVVLLETPNVTVNQGGRNSSLYLRRTWYAVTTSGVVPTRTCENDE